ncbi:MULTISPECIES: hypothetical protein [unclassified Streptomyces]|uniref:hypothetical protein n=1 Tax=unclassified Streptomyces TaxID=2593676 RepID=UPI0033AAF12D
MEEAPEDRPTPRRRGRTALLIAGAAALGVIAGTCTGYLIQADRPPTPLPPLSQPVLGQAKGPAPEPLSAAQDRKVKADGDLRKLLLKKPAGARYVDWAPGEDGWMDIAAYADTYDDPAGAFDELVADEYRRAAITLWEAGDQVVEIRLVQFRQEQHVTAAETVEDSRLWARDEYEADSWPIPGTGNGTALTFTRPEKEPGYEPYYRASALACRGDIMMQIFVSDTKPISKKTIMDLSVRQLERL